MAARPQTIVPVDLGQCSSLWAVCFGAFLALAANRTSAGTFTVGARVCQAALAPASIWASPLAFPAASTTLWLPETQVSRSTPRQPGYRQQVRPVAACTEDRVPPAAHTTNKNELTANLDGNPSAAQ